MQGKREKELADRQTDRESKECREWEKTMEKERRGRTQKGRQADS